MIKNISELKKNDVVLILKCNMFGVAKQECKVERIEGSSIIYKENKPRKRKLFIINIDKSTLVFLKNDFDLLLERDIRIAQDGYTTTSSTGNYKMGFVNNENEIKETVKKNINKLFTDDLFVINRETREFIKIEM